jgi:hypothetical protein
MLVSTTFRRRKERDEKGPKMLLPGGPIAAGVVQGEKGKTDIADPELPRPARPEGRDAARAQPSEVFLQVGSGGRH